MRSWSHLQELREQHRDLSAPLLLDLPAQYFEQQTRLVVVGKETGPRCWRAELDSSTDGARAVRELMRRYLEFGMGTKSGTSHFWRFMRAAETRLGIEEGQALWSNLQRCSVAGRRPKELEDELWRVFPVLEQELELVRPEVILFVTGPEYDELLEARLGARLRPIRRWPLDALARVEAPSLPHASFRTYHPNFLLRFRKPMSGRLLRALPRLSIGAREARAATR